MMQAICRLSMCSVLLLSLVGQVSSQAINDPCADVSACTGITNVECRDDGGGGGFQCLCQTGYSATDATNCDPIDCGGLTDPTDGSIAFTAGTTYNSQADYSCVPGFQLTGTSPRICQADGFWSGAEDQVCQAIDCPALNNPNDGSVSLSNGNNHLSEATFSCNTGYNLVGDATRTCEESGSWSGTADPTCEVVTCPALNNPNDGSVSPSNGNNYLSVATFSCNTGYNLVGDATRTCEESGSWSGTADPTCEVVIQNADCSSVTACGDTTNYVCDTTTDTCEVKADGVKTDCANTDGNCPAHASCATTVCNCDAGWTHAIGLCTAIVGYSCTVDSECTALDSNTECSSGSCACVSGYTNAAGGACLASDGLKLTASGFGVYLSILLMSIFL